MTRKTSYDTLFKEYLRVCNTALSTNKECFPYDRICQQICFLLKNHAVQVVICDESEQKPKAMYDMVLKDNQLTAKPTRKLHARHPWVLSTYFLEQVASQPETYIYNPAQLNWKWLTDRSVGV